MSYKPWHSKEYEAHIDKNSPEWQEFCEARLDLDGHRCVCCGKPAAITKRGKLAIHHIRYKEDAVGGLKDVISVCDMCHGMLHGYIDPSKRPAAYNPTTPDAQAKLRDYIAYTDAVIDRMQA